LSIKNIGNICVIGSGVIGLSCADLLLKLGYNVTLYTAQDPRSAPLTPEFASLFPAASIIPHSVSSNKLSQIFLDSKDCFEALYKAHFPGISKNLHFELFSEECSLPGYVSMMDKFQAWEDLEQTFYPRHPEVDVVHGWKFECFFADWSLYFDALLNEVLSQEADLVIKKISPEEVSKLPFEYIINCAGMGVVSLFEETENLIYRGHLIQIPGAPMLRSPDGKTVSYNFTPGANIYQTKDGNLQDVYCYPRHDGWVFGGSRQQGKLDENGNWNGDSHLPPTEIINGIEVPVQILKLNHEIIEHSFGVGADKFPTRKAKLGYRYVRNNENGLRIEVEEFGNKLIIHNYGHGGSGVALSWGSALKVIRLLDKLH